MASIIAEGKQQYFANTGLPLVGGKLFTYAAGTLTPKATFADADGVVQNTNPIILNSRGEALVFWSGSYKVVLKDSLDNVIWTVDKVTETNLGYRTSATGSALIPVGTTAQRDAVPDQGYFRYNTDTDTYEAYFAASWSTFPKSVNGFAIPASGDVVLKTINGVDIVGIGNIAVQSVLVSATNIKTINGNSVLGAGNLLIANPAMVLLAGPFVPTAIATVDFLNIFSALYDSYVITGAGIKPSASDSLSIRFANAGVVDVGAKYYGTTDNLPDTVAGTSIMTSMNVVNTGTGNFEISIQNINDAANIKTVHVKGVSKSTATPEFRGVSCWGVYDSANIVSGFRLFWDTAANFSAQGAIYIYGITK